MVAMVLLSQDSSELALSILHLVAFIDDDILPIVLVESQPILQYEIVGCDADIPFGTLHYLLDLVSCCWVASIDNFSDRWGPFIEFRHPVGDGGKRDNDQEWTIVLLELYQV